MMIRTAVIDIETTELTSLLRDIEKIHCIAVKINNEKTLCFSEPKTEYTDGTLSDALDLINTADLVIGHNIAKFDKPVIQDKLGIIKPPIIDTLIDSKLVYAKDKLYAIDSTLDRVPKHLKGSYSLEAFGHRLTDYKIDFNDWSKLTEEMVIYCKQDVDLTYKLWKFLQTRPNYPSVRVRELEYRVAEIIGLQEQFGCYFDIDKARAFATTMKFAEGNVNRKLAKTFPPRFVPDGDIVIPANIGRKTKGYETISLPKYYNLIPNLFKELTIDKHGRYKKIPKSTKWFTEPQRLIYTYYLGEYQKIKLQVFNPNSTKQVTDNLKSVFNWEAKTFTKTGNPKFDKDALKLALFEAQREGE